MEKLVFNSYKDFREYLADQDSDDFNWSKKREIIIENILYYSFIEAAETHEE